MARSNNNLKAVLQDTADAIRAKTGSSYPIVPRDFADEISGIQTGGGDEDFKNFLTGDLKSFNYSASYFENKELREGAFAFAEMYNVSLSDCWRVRKNMFWNATIDEINANDAILVDNNAFANCVASRISLNNVEEINEYGLTNCFLESISLPKVWRIGNFGFQSCHNLREVTFGDDLITCTTRAFNDCTKLESIDFKYASGGIFTGSYAFGGCYNLKKVVINNIVSNGFQSGAFAGCSNLEEFGNSFLIASAIASYCFNSCYKLKEINLANAENIGSYCFQNCYDLSKAIIAGSVYNYAFNNCSKLESVYMVACSLQNLVNSNAFNGTPIADSSYLGRYGSIYVPSSWVASYKTANNWSFFSDRITAMPSEFNEEYIYAYEFYGRSDLTEIPSEKANAKYVGRYAFYNCNNITSIEHSNINVIGNSAFVYAKLNYVSMPNCSWIMASALATQNKSLRTLWLPKCICIHEWNFTNESYLTSACNFDNLRIIDFRGQNYLGSCLSLPEARSVRMSRAMYGAYFDISNFNLPKIIDLRIENGSAEPFSVDTSINFSKVRVFFLTGTSKVTYISVPDALEVCFSNCTNLSSFYCPNVISISMSGFKNTKIQQATFSRALSVPYEGFRSCALLEKVRFDDAEETGGSAFTDCISLERIMFGNLKTMTADYFVNNCPKLESIYLFGKSITSFVPATVYSTFFSSPIIDSSYLGHYGSIYVPGHLLNEYKMKTGWSQYSDRFVGMTESEMQYVIDHWDD